MEDNIKTFIKLLTFDYKFNNAESVLSVLASLIIWNLIVLIIIII